MRDGAAAATVPLAVVVALTDPHRTGATSRGSCRRTGLRRRHRRGPERTQPWQRSHPFAFLNRQPYKMLPKWLNHRLASRSSKG